ncbi:hypothetical protein GCM10010330_16070 [Streptomyces tendae]|uniref:hypothetical protein n=1 Tax=Streptomyces tendae TaxID=1932 RepID=UPI00167793D2|nr:hypothetical protein [Streptomyces tendae]GHA64034.1 hypothetical protein GCM10010330_16070 [Streptomyces tendae]
MIGLSEDDIAAAREQGDLAALVLMSSGLAIRAPKQRAVPKAPPLARVRPGAWPDGTQSPGLTPEAAAYLAQLWPDRYPSAGHNQERSTTTTEGNLS